MKFLTDCKIPEIAGRVCPDAMPEVAALSSGVPGQTASMPVRLGSTRSDNDTHSHLTDTDIDIMIDGLLEDLERKCHLRD